MQQGEPTNITAHRPTAGAAPTSFSLAPQGAIRRIILVLPAFPRRADGVSETLIEVQRLGLADRYSALCIEPLFPITPWYADHPTDPHHKQESVVLNLAEAARSEHLGLPVDLLGFSKSGFGAMALLLRHPDRFSAVAAFDVPFMHPAPDRWGMAEVFVTQANYDRHAFSKLLHQQATTLKQQRPRIAILGGVHFPSDCQAAHELCDQLRVPHAFEAHADWQHTWTSGWLPRAFELLATMDGEQTTC